MVSSLTTKSADVATKPVLGVVAGSGKLPQILVRSAREKGYKVIAFCMTEDAKARLSPLADSWHEIAPGQLGRNTQLFKEEGVQFTVFAGKLNKVELLRNVMKIDLTAIKELSRLSDFNDDSIQRGIGGYMEQNGIKVLTQVEFLTELFPSVGVISHKQPSAEDYSDIDFGMKVATEIARLDIGQTVIVKDRMILAIEAIEGTDAAIRRGVELAKGPVVVVKVAKPQADRRFDTPTVGMNTLNAMVAPKPGGVLALASGETMMVDRDEMVAFADKHQMSIVSVSRT